MSLKNLGMYPVNDVIRCVSVIRSAFTLHNMHPGLVHYTILYQYQKYQYNNSFN